MKSTTKKPKRKSIKIIEKSINLNLDPYISHISNIIIQIEQLYREPCLSKKLSLINELPTLKPVKEDQIQLNKTINAEKNQLKKNVFDKLLSNFISQENIENSYNHCKILISGLIELVKFFKSEYSHLKNKLNYLTNFVL